MKRKEIMDIIEENINTIHVGAPRSPSVVDCLVPVRIICDQLVALGLVEPDDSEGLPYRRP